MHDVDTIRRWLDSRPTPGQEEHMADRPTTQNTQSGGVPLGGNDTRLRGIRDRIQKDVARNGVRPRAADSPRRRGR